MKVIENGYYVIHYGDRHHDETQGVVGHAPDRITVVASPDELPTLPEWTDRKLGLTSQTTASQEEFAEFQILAKQKWPHLEVFDTICNATEPAAERDHGSGAASGYGAGGRLQDIGQLQAAGRHLQRHLAGGEYLIDRRADIKDDWFDDE